jgi:hypothetical protein
MVNAPGMMIGATPFGSFSCSFTSYDIPGGKVFLISPVMEVGVQAPFAIFVATPPIRTFPFLAPKPEPVTVSFVPIVPLSVDSSGGGFRRSNVAVTVTSPVMLITQISVPEHPPPLHPPKTESASAVAVRVCVYLAAVRAAVDADWIAGDSARSCAVIGDSEDVSDGIKYRSH